MSGVIERQCNYCRDRWRSETDEGDDTPPPPSERRLQLCSGCRLVRYCCQTHQKRDWLEHIFDCKPDQVTTAHHLVRSIKMDIHVAHPQTLVDYGFTRVKRNHEQIKLYGLYAGLIKYIPMVMSLPRGDGTYLNPKKIHQWRVKGVLVAEIKKAFEALPPSSRGGYYPWFLQNEHILDPSTSPPEFSDLTDEESAAVDNAFRRAWIYSGGSPELTHEESMHIFRTLSQSDRSRYDCVYFITMIYARAHFSPRDTLWIPFGFCACDGSEGEASLARSYMRLIASCAFEVFLEAVRTKSVVALMSRSDIRPFINSEAAAFEDVMKGTTKSVWDLKAFILGNLENREEMGRSAEVDYGFINCRTEPEAIALRLAYRRYFDHRDCRPLDLHAACIQGRTYEHVDSVVRLKDKSLRRLMKNVYSVV